MALLVIEPGLYTLPVGRPRLRTRHLGVPVGGPADVESCQRANAFLGNSPDATALEIALLGPKLQALQPILGAVFGAAVEMKSSCGQMLEVGRSFRLEAGEVLTLGGFASGCRAYFAVRGGFPMSAILGSETGLGPIQRGQRLDCTASSFDVRTASVAHAPSGGTIRCLPGPQYDWFPDSNFFTQTYTVSAKSDRMGVRLLGEPILSRPGELISEPVAPGAVQITNDGLPVILGVDGQTIGGYPKVAHVIRADLDAVGQLRPGEPVRFRQVTVSDTRELERERLSARRRLLSMWAAAPKSPIW